MSGPKIVATIGPNTATADALRSLCAAGMDVARLNGSHSDIEWHRKTAALIRQVDPNMPILLDLPGGKIRTSKLVQEFTVAPGQLVIFASLQNGQISHHSQPEAGTPLVSSSLDKVVIDYSDFHNDIQTGDTIVMDDGGLSLTVDDVVGYDVICIADQRGVIRSAQGVHLPDSRSVKVFPSDRDLELLKFATSIELDFIGLSFVETADQVGNVRKLIGGQKPAIIAKIETRQAVDNLSSIIEASDALMIDRGDLSVATGLETIGLLQKHVLAEATQAAKPVIVATEILQSMINNPFPTKAEVSDITNSVLDGATALMLSGETAIGDYPVEAVTIMRRVADAVSQNNIGHAVSSGPETEIDVAQVMGEAIATICSRLDITKIVAITMSGYAARMVAAKSPSQPILAVSNDSDAARRFNLLRGVRGIHVDIPFSRTKIDHIPLCLEELWCRGELVDEDLILITAVGYPKSGNRMNLIETHKVADLIDSLGWAKNDTEENSGTII